MCVGDVHEVLAVVENGQVQTLVGLQLLQILNCQALLLEIEETLLFEARLQQLAVQRRRAGRVAVVGRGVLLGQRSLVLLV